MLKDVLLEVDGQQWLVREALSHEAALNEIAMARVTGSVGSKAREDETLCGGSVTVIADVERFTGDVADNPLSGEACTVRATALFDQSAGHIAVKHGLITLPSWVAEACRMLHFDPHGTGVCPQEATFWTVQLYTAMGTIPQHQDFEADEPHIRSTLGVVLLNEPEACLCSPAGLLPLTPGTIFRIDPREPHGTCLPNGSQATGGKFVFITCDYGEGEEEAPDAFASWICQSIFDRLADAWRRDVAGMFPRSVAVGVTPTRMGSPSTATCE